jgi:hypothetical protein
MGFNNLMFRYKLKQLRMWLFLPLTIITSFLFFISMFLAYDVKTMKKVINQINL